MSQSRRRSSILQSYQIQQQRKTSTGYSLKYSKRFVLPMNSIKSGIANGSRSISGLLAMSSHACSLQSTSTTKDDLLRLRGTPLWPTYSFQTINKPNCNPSFIATVSLSPIHLVLPIGFNSFATSAAFSSKRKAKKQVAFLACQALSELHLPPTLYNLTKTVPPQDLIESQEQQPSQQSSDSNSLLIF
ncbi:hypothetical protein O181_101005 [Austropuccinia psidii MF-1]|uniref:Uncharacterized protein n=1 Tax=Austropuccinia psidii MF-1 TaxID=1389203 RepID=A0A9Q3PHC9_9BASI|nr:hypothetical protein [Austropuccinia psidii MF-1]